MLFRSLRIFHTAFISGLILWSYLWFFYQSANTPLRDASVEALLPAAAWALTAVGLYTLTSHPLIVECQRRGSSRKRGDLDHKAHRSSHRLYYGVADHRKLVLLDLWMGPQIERLTAGLKCCF